MKVLFKDNYYKMTGDSDEEMGGSFCGKVSENVVHTSDFMEGEVNTIMGFYVQLNCREQGHGTALMNQIIEMERERGTDYLNLGVSKDNETAIRLYERCGFVSDGDLELNDKLTYMWIKL